MRVKTIINYILFLIIMGFFIYNIPVALEKEQEAYDTRISQYLHQEELRHGQ